jgi:hypothetical protein
MYPFVEGWGPTFLFTKLRFAKEERYLWFTVYGAPVDRNTMFFTNQRFTIHESQDMSFTQKEL